MDPKAVDINTGEPVKTYEPPFERADRAYDEAMDEARTHGGDMTHAERVMIQLHTAQVDMLKATFEVLERIERNTRDGDSGAVESLLERMTGARPESSGATNAEH